MGFNKDVLMELLLDLDKLKEQINETQDKLCKIILSNTKPKSVVSVYTKSNGDKK